ncbi:MAG: DNA adenine methylase [Synechococcaceae cyanobacterium]|jgi:adenine-specific DNA-methyltransferase
MIKYLGSKRRLIPQITACLALLPRVRRVIDLFSGTARVAMALKREGYVVRANDHNSYSHLLAQCYVEADARDWQKPAAQLIAELNALPGRAGFVTEAYCLQSRYFQPHNGERIDAIRDRIETMALPPLLRAIAITSLIEAADRVDSTTGLQMAYLKRWAPRSYEPLELRLPDLTDRCGQRRCSASQQDAQVVAADLKGDCVYLDPPYNQHSYLSNYHIWETLARWDQPELYGIAMKRHDCRERRSVFNSKRHHRQAFETLIAALRVPYLVVSFSDEGFISRAEMEAILASKGHVHTWEHPYRRYVGARIGICNQRGEVVGKVSHLNNREYLYLVSPKPLDLTPLDLTLPPEPHEVPEPAMDRSPTLRRRS